MDMDFAYNNEFNECVSSFKNLSLSDKKEMVEREINELILVLNSLNKEYDKDFKVLFNREILDLKKKYQTEDDFVEAIFVYMCSIKESIATLIENMSK